MSANVLPNRNVHVNSAKLFSQTLFKLLNQRVSSCCASATINHKLKQIAMKFIALPSVIFQQLSFSFTSEIKSQKTPKISHLSKRKKYEMINVDESPYEGDKTLPNEFHIKRTCGVVYSTKYQSKFPNLSSLTRKEFSLRRRESLALLMIWHTNLS